MARLGDQFRALADGIVASRAVRMQATHRRRAEVAVLLARFRAGRFRAEVPSRPGADPIVLVESASLEGNRMCRPAARKTTGARSGPRPSTAPVGAVTPPSVGAPSDEVVVLDLDMDESLPGEPLRR